MCIQFSRGNMELRGKMRNKKPGGNIKKQKKVKCDLKIPGAIYNFDFVP